MDLCYTLYYTIIEEHYITGELMYSFLLLLFLLLHLLLQCTIGIKSSAEHEMLS